MKTLDPKRRSRRLSPEEIDIWRKVAATVERRAGALLPEDVRRGSEPPEPVERPAAVVAPPVPLPASVVPPQLAPIERTLKRKLVRGRIAADASLDLHGYRQAEAHTALRAFLRGAQAQGARVVIVVTGKGDRGREAPRDAGGHAWGEGGVGVLKRLVPLWLSQPEFRDVVVGFEDAGPVHGGTGALYVRIRRPR